MNNFTDILGGAMPQEAKWITSGKLNDKSCSLPPEVFKKDFEVDELPKASYLFISALGIYRAELNGAAVGKDWFTPGYTNYKKHLQVQKYDVTSLLHKGSNKLCITVANGWALGRIGPKGYNVYSDTRALIAALSFGDKVAAATDESWGVSDGGKVRFADFYDGEVIDNTVHAPKFERVKVFTGKTPALMPHLGTFVRQYAAIKPDIKKSGNSFLADFNRNFAGVVKLKVRAKAGAKITVRHAEILINGKPFYGNLRSAKAILTLVCRDGEQEFCPHFTYMGFRYAEITCEGEVQIMEIEGVALSSDMKSIGKFECSDSRINAFQSAICGGLRSNFMDIPTDCPQRDERLGWTGDIAVFARTAAFNTDISQFMQKWLTDLRSEQSADGAIPVTIPCSGVYEPAKKPIPVALWGDAAVLVPWAVFRAYGSLNLLESCYESMKSYVLCEQRVAERHGRGDKKYLWNRNKYQYGDWCCYGENWLQWTRKGKHLATLFYYNSINIVLQAARLLKREKDESYFSSLAQEVQAAFAKYYILPDGRLKGADFMSMYVCALYFGIVPQNDKNKVAERLAKLVKDGGYTVRTGFPGTPYLLFALADNSYADVAFKVLLNERCPGWLHMVKQGATTTWERWDAVEEDGTFFHGGAGMVSFNHYAYGAVGDFFYRRILGLEEEKAGYKSFTVRPVCGPLAYAKGSLMSPFGKICVSWRRENGKFKLKVTVPASCTAQIITPRGAKYSVAGGEHTFEEEER